MTQEPRDPNAPLGEAPPPQPGAAPPPSTPPPAQPSATPPGAAPPPQQSWQSQPQQPGAPPPAGGTAGAAPLPPGPLQGTQIADFVTRLVAYIIDGVILAVANYVVSLILFGILPFPINLIVHAVVIVAISAGYFIYFWTTRRQTPGMIVMKLLVVEDGTGNTLPQDKAIRRWLYLGLPLALSSLVSIGGGFGFVTFGLGGLAILLTLALLVGVAALGWQIYLAYATSQDARKQGPHDKAVNSVVISYGPSPFSQQRP